MKGSLIQQRKVVAVLDQWSRYANIKFEHRENLNEATIRISFEERFGSFSYIGRTIETIPRDKATMNLGWLEDMLLFTDLERAVLLHEIGHTLGLSHEHASPALGGQVTLKQEGESIFCVNAQWSDSLRCQPMKIIITTLSEALMKLWWQGLSTHMPISN